MNEQPLTYEMLQSAKSLWPRVWRSCKQSFGTNAAERIMREKYIDHLDDVVVHEDYALYLRHRTHLDGTFTNREYSRCLPSYNHKIIINR